MKRSFLFRLRSRVWSAAGLAALAAPFAVACGGLAVVNDDGGSGGSSGTGNSTGNGNGNGNSTGTGNSTGNGSGGSVSVGQTGAVVSSSSGGPATTIGCFAIFDVECPDVKEADLYFVCTDDGFYVEEWISGPLESEDGTGCYEVILSEDGCAIPGRPFIQQGAALTASLARRDNGWAGDARSSDNKQHAISELSNEERALLAAMWSDSGLFEHASVASFARFALELMAVGAPAALVQAAHEAARDEVVHAQLCFALAARYAGTEVGPNALPIAGPLTVRGDLTTLAAATAAEGCIGETLAAAVASAQLAEACDPEVRAALQTIADDEARHAELAWRTVAWAIEQGDDDVRRAVADVFARAQEHALAPPSTSHPIAAHGLLDARQHRDVQLHTLTTVIMPCASALLQQRPSAPVASTAATC